MKNPIVLSYDEAKRLHHALETIRTLARGAIQDLRCGLPGRALIKLEQLEHQFPTSIGDPDAAQKQNDEENIRPFKRIGEILPGTSRPWL